MKKSSIYCFVFIIILGLFIISPKHVVWGGSSGQTVPTVGPSPTASVTSTQTPTQSPFETITATQIVTQQPTVAITLITLVENTSTGTESTNNPDAEINQETEAISSPDASQTAGSSNGDNSNQTLNENKQSEPSQEDENSGPEYLPPKCLFPLTGAIILVLFYLIIKRIIQDRNNKNHDK